jgi:hypothetical protein
MQEQKAKGTHHVTKRRVGAPEGATSLKGKGGKSRDRNGKETNHRLRIRNWRKLLKIFRLSDL